MAGYRYAFLTEGLLHPTFRAQFRAFRALQQLLGPGLGWVRGLRSLAILEPASVVLCVLYIHHPKDAPACVEVLREYVRAGGRLLALHGASASFKGSSRYEELLGGAFAGHGRISGLTLEWTSASAAAPSISADTVGAGAGVMGEPIVDEPYRHRVGDGVDVIARWHCRIGGSGSGPRAPSEASGEAAWTRQYGDGRVGYLALGHRSRTWANPEVVRLLEYLTSWCLTGVRS